MLSFVIIDRYPIIRTGIDLFLKNQFTKIHILESDSIVNFLEIYPAYKPDVVILGLNQYPDILKINLVTAAKQAYPTAKLIIYDDILYSQLNNNARNMKTIARYMKEGVNGYLSKGNNLSELIDCIHDIFIGKNYISTEKFIQTSQQETAKLPKLTKREFEIAVYISKGMTTNGIAQKLKRASSTISTTKATIFKKLKVDNVLNLRDVMQEIEISQANLG